MTGMNKKPLLERLTKKMLADLQERKRRNRDVADELGVSETYLSRKIATLQAKNPGETVAHRKAAQALFATRRGFREKLAKKILSSKGRLTIAQAAEEANCSERTMFRYVQAYRPEK